RRTSRACRSEAAFAELVDDDGTGHEYAVDRAKVRDGPGVHERVRKGEGWGMYTAIPVAIWGWCRTRRGAVRAGHPRPRHGAARGDAHGGWREAVRAVGPDQDRRHHREGRAGHVANHAAAVNAAAATTACRQIADDGHREVPGRCHRRVVTASHQRKRST